MMMFTFAVLTLGKSKIVNWERLSLSSGCPYALIYLLSSQEEFRVLLLIRELIITYGLNLKHMKAIF